MGSTKSRPLLRTRSAWRSSEATPSWRATQRNKSTTSDQLFVPPFTPLTFPLFKKFFFLALVDSLLMRVETQTRSDCDWKPPDSAPVP